MQLLEHTADVSRLVAVGTNGRRLRQTVAAGIPALFMPMNMKTTIELNYGMGRGYTVFFALGTDIKISDRLLWNGKQFIVGAVMSYDVVAGGVGHIRALAEQEVNP